MKVETHTTTADVTSAPATRRTDRTRHGRRRRIAARRRGDRPRAQPRGLPRRHRERHHRLDAGRLRLRLGVLAVLSARRTSQPQRWAAVPAVAMTATGVGLVVFAPGDAAMSALNWVWPPLVLGLVGWMSVQVRRSLTGRGRWLLVPVLAVLAIAPVGATVENVSEAQVRDGLPGPGHDVRRRRPPDAPVVPGRGQPHGRAVQRHGRDLHLVGPHHRPGPVHHPGVCLRPRRPGMERGRGLAPRTGSRPPPTCTRCSPPPTRTARSSSRGTPSAAPTR